MALAEPLREVAADGIYQTADNRAAVPEVLGPQARLRAPIHPGRTQPKPMARPGPRSARGSPPGSGSVWRSAARSSAAGPTPHPAECVRVEGLSPCGPP